MIRWQRYFLGFMLSIPAMAHAWNLENIYFAVDGDEDIPRLHGLVNLKKGEEFSYKKIDEALARLGQSGKFRYLESRVSESTKSVYFVLRTIYRVRKVSFNFQSHFNLDSNRRTQLELDLKDEISVKADDPVDLGQLSLVNTQVVQRLEARGYVGAQAITLFEEIPKTQFRDLIVNVVLPKPVFYREFKLTGFSRSEENSIISSYANEMESPHFSRDAKSGTFTSNDSRMDLVALNNVLESYSKNLREQGYYDARVDYDAAVDKGSILIKQVRGTKYRVDFTGNVYFWERFLREKSLQRIENFSVPFDANDVASQVSNLYKQDGYKDIKIQWNADSKKDGTQDQSSYVFNVTEGKQFFLGDVIFLGGVGREESLDAEDAKQQWLTSISDPLHYPYFDEDAIRGRIGALLKLIREKGYIEAKFVDLRFEPREHSNRVDMIVNLQIGQKFYVDSVSFSGLSFLTAKEINAFSDIRVGDPISTSKVFAVNARIESYLKNHGFLEAQLENSEDLIFRKRPTSNRIDIVFQASAGPKILVGRTVIEGNEATKTKVVEREMYERTLVSGQPWSLDGERRLKENLLALGIFGSAQTEKISGRVVGVDPKYGFEIQQKDLKIDVRERPAGSIEFGPGYRTDLGIVGFTEFNYRNLFGENYGFLTRTQVSRKLVNYKFLEQQYSMTLMDPYFLSKRIRLRTSASYQKRDDRVFSDGVGVKGFSIEEANVALSAEFLLAEKWSWIQNIYTISNPRLFGIIDTETATQVRSERFRIGTIGSSLIYDNRDNIFNPNRGWVLESAMEFASPFLGSDSDVNFMTYRQDVTKYIRTGPGSVIALSGEYARLWGFSQSARGVPANKRLFLGGQTSLRFLPEKALRYDDAGIQGQQSFEFKAEYRQPWIYDLSIAFFLDVGRLDVLEPTSKRELSSGWREGTGIGMRYVTPVGPIALDFAFNLNPKPSESNYQIQFSIGVF